MRDGLVGVENLLARRIVGMREDGPERAVERGCVLEIADLRKESIDL